MVEVSCAWSRGSRDAAVDELGFEERGRGGERGSGGG